MAEFNDAQFYQYPPLHPPIPEYTWKKDADYLEAVYPNADYLESVVSREADFITPIVSSVGTGPKGDKGDTGPRGPAGPPGGPVSANSIATIHLINNAVTYPKLSLELKASNELDDSSIAPVEQEVSSSNYTVGSYLIFDRQLCKVTTAIATGEQIVIGSNVTTTTLAEELMALQEG